jgi:hypothetical protein
MKFKNYRQTLPSNREYSVPLLMRLIKQIEAGIGRKISAEEWNKL